MCGITGWYAWSRSIAQEESKALLGRMCNVICHRGPDEEGMHFDAHAGRADSSVALGIRRLSIIDLSTGSQPMHNEDGSLWVVCNGEIYNFKELRKDLERRGHRFYTRSDIETIVHLYEENGTALVEKLRGMFAFALWDRKKNTLFIARDRLGKKPLYYTLHNGTLLFGSELKSILEYPSLQRTIDPAAIDLYLTYQYIPSPFTVFRGIYKLPPAHYLTCGPDGVVKTQRYWELDFRRKGGHSRREWEELLLSKLRESVRLRMVSDVPLGAFLSGGIDSSAVVALMAKEATRPVKTFSIGFPEDDFCELKYARSVARRFGTEHQEFTVEPKAADILSKIAWHYGEPFADPSALPSYYVANLTRQHVTVALTGDGGDESFAGYLRYRAFRLSQYAGLLNPVLHTTLLPISNLLLRYTHGPFRKLLHRAQQYSSSLNESPAVRNMRWHTIFGSRQRDELYSSGMKSLLQDTDTDAYTVHYFTDAPAADDIDRLLYTDIMTYLPECLLVKMDIASMANSLEARSPFLDHEFMELAASMPSNLKMHGLTGKYILKKALKGILPDEILYRRKMGFGIPVDRWFRNELREHVREFILSPRTLSRGYFEPAAIERLVYDHWEGKAEHGYRLWALLMLELWHREYLKDFKLT